MSQSVSDEPIYRAVFTAKNIKIIEVAELLIWVRSRILIEQAVG